MENDDVVIETDGTEEGGSEDRFDAKAKKLREEIESLKKEKQEYLDGWQRAKADYVNALKRFEEEKRGAVALGSLVAARAFIPAMDSLGRAAESGEVPEAYVGISKQLEEAARALGLERFGAVGEAFNPNLHEALGQDPTDDAAKDDTVTLVLECGWKTKEAVVRPAKVRVAVQA
jgi:molecular chaperone GrpE